MPVTKKKTRKQPNKSKAQNKTVQTVKKKQTDNKKQPQQVTPDNTAKKQHKFHCVVNHTTYTDDPTYIATLNTNEQTNVQLFETKRKATTYITEYQKKVKLLNIRNCFNFCVHENLYLPNNF